MRKFCRDEHCDRLELHLEHAPVEVVFSGEEPSRSPIDPWLRPAPKALDHSIAKAVSKTYPKPLDTLLREVRHDYGDCNMRTVQRRLQRMVERGHILRIDLGRRLYAYLRPGSNMVNDLDTMREQIYDLMAQT